MRWKKKLLLPLLVVSLSLLLSVFGFANQVSAGTSRNISSITDNTSSYTRVGNAYNGHYYKDITGTGYIKLQDLSFTTSGNLVTNNKKGVELDFYMLVKDISPKADNFMAGAYCPAPNTGNYLGHFSVYECEIEKISRETFITRTTAVWPSSSQGLPYDEITEPERYQSIYYFHYYMILYKNQDDNYSFNSFSTYGPYIDMFYPSSTDSLTARIYILPTYVTDGIPINEPTADEKMNDKDDQDRADLENQSSETDSDANSAGADASNTGTSLLGVFSAFVSALATIHETNCRLPSMSVYGLQLGQMDLCTFDVPPGIIALATVGMVFIIVPLSFHLARRLVNIFRSFQG